jgi:hypothetical protein
LLGGEHRLSPSSPDRTNRERVGNKGTLVKRCRRGWGIVISAGLVANDHRHTLTQAIRSSITDRFPYAIAAFVTS